MKLKRQEIFILLLIWSVGGGIVLALGLIYVISTQKPQEDMPLVTAAPAPTYTVTYVDVTAKKLYPPAKGESRVWQSDAQLVSVSTRWRSTAIDLVGQPTDWSYTFYSRARKNILVVDVTPDGQVNTSQYGGGTLSDVPYVVPEEKWILDSTYALASWLNHGGATMLSYLPGTEVAMQLNMLTEKLGPYWTVVGYNFETEDYMTVIMSAEDGEVLETKSPRQ